MLSFNNLLSGASVFYAIPPTGVSGDLQDLSANVTATPAHVRVLRSKSEVEEVSGAWRQMQWHPNADIDFYDTVLRSTPTIRHPYILVLDHCEEPSALLVGRIEEVQFSPSIGYLQLPGLRVRVLTFIYGGLLGDPDRSDCELFARQIRESLKHGDADIAFFNHLRADSFLFETVMRQSGRLLRDYLPSLTSHWRVVLSDNVAELWQRQSPKVRRNHRQEAQKLLRKYNGDVRVECLSKTSDLDRMLHDVEEVAAKTYQRGLRVGFSSEPGERMRLQLKAERGWLRTYILYIGGKPCAFFSGTLYKGVLHGDFMGYDPAYRQHSPGRYLVMQMIESLSKEKNTGNINAIDFGLGDARYKADICNDEWQDASFYLFASTPRGIACNAYRTPVLFVDHLVRKMLGSGQQERTKKLWRRFSMQNKWTMGRFLTRLLHGDGPS
jgi:hypothetical protein